MTSRIRGRIAWIAVAAWMAVIFGLSSLPGSAVPGQYGSWGHFGVYAVLGALVAIALDDGRPTWRTVLLSVGIASLYGVTDELHQSFVPGRVPDPADWLVDTIGALAGSGATRVVLRTRHTADGRHNTNGQRDA